MRNLNLLNKYRLTSAQVISHYGGIGDDTCGAFAVQSPIDKQPMMIIASSGVDWDHVSVSRANRPPNWREMCHVKDLFFGDETVMQLHVPKAEHVNDHPHCLHLWRPHKIDIPRPPSWTVGGVSQDDARKKYDAAVVDGATP